MDIRQLKFFVAVAEHLNFTEASKYLYVAQSAVSYQISELEKELGVKLFARDKHSVNLTSAGKVLLKEAHVILDRSHDAIEKTRQAAAGLLGNLKICFLGVPVISKLPELIRKFHSNYSNITIDLDQMNAEEITEALENGDMDIGFTRSLCIQDKPDLLWKKVYVDSISVVMRHDHPMANLPSINISSLAQEHFISINRQNSPGIADLTIRLCSSRGFSPNIVSKPHYIEAVLCMVDAGLGISILPDCFKSYPLPDLRFIPVEGDDANIDLVVAWNKNTSNQSIPLFLEELMKHYAE